MSFQVCSNLSEIYSDFNDSISNYHSPRINSLISKFESIYKRKPSFIARAPGRVNLIGEHIDYMGKIYKSRLRSVAFCLAERHGNRFRE